MEARFTLVFTVEDGIWKLVQRHGSVGKPNVDIHGAEQRAIDELMQAARTAFALDQREGKAAIMFTDVADSAHLAATLGDTTWTKTIRQHLADVTQAIAAQNGRLVKSLGDGTMSMFQSPKSALRTALAIQRTAQADPDDRRLRVRIGIHSGDVIEAEDDFFGTVVNKAARIAGVAQPDEIRVSDETRIAAPEALEFRFDAPVIVPLKGLQGEHLIHRLEWRR